MIQTQTPAPRGRTLTARAAPSPDSLHSAGLKPPVQELNTKGPFLFCLQWRNNITEENVMPMFQGEGLDNSFCCMAVTESDRKKDCSALLTLTILH